MSLEAAGRLAVHLTEPPGYEPRSKRLVFFFAEKGETTSFLKTKRLICAI